MRVHRLYKAQQINRQNMSLKLLMLNQHRRLLQHLLIENFLNSQTLIRCIPQYY